MIPNKILLLCGNRMALPSMRDLVFSGQLAAVGIPAHCDEFIEQATAMLRPLNIPIVTIPKENCNEILLNTIDAYSINIGIIISFSYRISSDVFNKVSKGFYNMHPGPLPEYRGPDPIFQQIKNREKFAAITLHKLDKNFDSGDIIGIEKIVLHPTDTHGMLTTRLAETCSKMLAQLLKIISFDVAIPGRKQNIKNVKYFKRQTAEDIAINWQTMDALSIVALANACNPWNKGAVTKINDSIVRIVDATASDNENITSALPGTILEINEGNLMVAAKNGQLKIGIIYIDEGFLNALKLLDWGVKTGDIFKSIY